MRTAMFFLLALAFSSCVLSSCGSLKHVTIPRDALGRPQPVEVDSLAPDIPEACRDSLFLALQTKPVSQMTAYEKAYFQQKWDECNGTPAVNHGSTPEWIVAALYLVGAAVVLFGILLVP